MTFRAVTDVQVTRVVIAGTPVAGEVAVGGVETQLSPGDSALFPPFVAGEIRNVGDVPVVLLAAIIGPVGAPDAATPTAATPGAEGTPLTDEEAPAGLSFQGLAFGQADQLPGGPAAIGIGRLNLEPGATIPAHPHPGPEFGVVEAGTASFTVSEGQVEILRRITTATPGPEAPETEMVGASEEVTLQAGDGFFSHPGTVADFRNEGDTPLVVLGGGVEPLTGDMATPMAATPAT